MVTGRLDLETVQALPAREIEGIGICTPSLTNVGREVDGFFDGDLGEELSIRRVHMECRIGGVAHSGVNIALRIDVDPIRSTVGQVHKDPPITQGTVLMKVEHPDAVKTLSGFIGGNGCLILLGLGYHELHRSVGECSDIQPLLVRGNDHAVHGPHIRGDAMDGAVDVHPVDRRARLLDGFMAQIPGIGKIDPAFLIDGGTAQTLLYVAIDRASRMVHLAVKDEETEACATAFPFKVTHVLTDRGSCFTADGFEAACRKLGVQHRQHRKTKPDTPQTNGMVEQFNGRIGREVLIMCIGTHDALERLLLGYNLAYNARRQRGLNGQSPDQVVQTRL
jgi:hypothetical protein